MADQRRSVMVERLGWSLLLLAPWILRLGTGSFRPIWGAPEIPTWTVIAALAADAVGLALGWVGVRRGLPETHRGRYFALVALSVLAATPIVLVALFLLVHLLAVVLAGPYAFALVGVRAGWGRRTPKWVEE